MNVIKENRFQRLVDLGVPGQFLEILKKSKEHEQLRYMIREPESFYYYIEQIHDTYSSIKEYNIIPIYEVDNGDVFYVYLYNEKNQMFARIDLEFDELAFNYGTNFNLMLADLLIEIYEEGELSIEEFSKFGIEIGVNFATELYKRLEEAEQAGLRRTFEDDKIWRNTNIEMIIKNSC
jgi:hypothetical protein